MLIGSSGLILISEFIGDNGLILIKWEKTKIEGRVIGGDLIRRRVVVVWCWSVVVVRSWSASSSATMVWSWSNEKNAIKGRVIGGDLIRRSVVWCWLAAVMWCWSAAVVWCWSMEFFMRQLWCWSRRVRREGEWAESTREKEIEKKKILKYLCKCYSNRAYMHGYCSNCA